jgi:glycosyltransferase involved in cell wall biosynthesis
MRSHSIQRTKRKALIVCSESPYPFVVGGYERLIEDYQHHVFTDYDVYFLDCRRDRLNMVHHYGAPLGNRYARRHVLNDDFAFALFVHSDFDCNGRRLISPLIHRIPSFFFTQYHPNPEIEDGRFRGIITHHSESPHKDVLRIGGSYNPEIFFKNRQSEEFIICVARIHPVKNQLELVRDYRERIYKKHHIPLYLVGGSSEPEYYALVKEYVDGVSVLSTCDPANPMAPTSWRTAREIAALCNRARMFVMPSEEESFSIALIEALACGTTCVLNGEYRGFDPEDLRPNVYGNIAGPDGSILSLIDEVLSRDIRIDGSEWVKKYSIAKTRRRLVSFIQKRL